MRIVLNLLTIAIIILTGIEYNTIVGTELAPLVGCGVLLSVLSAVLINIERSK